ncbi:MAG: YafY family protein [Pseudomonadota bacterium]
MATVDRLFSLIQLLRRRRGPTTASDIAASLGVSVRTVYRDIQRLQRSGTPIASEPGVGYRLLPSYDLAPVKLTTEEQQALDLALRLLARTGDCGLVRTADRLRQKLPCTDSLVDPVLHTSTWSPLFPATASPCALREAIDDECEIDIDYTDEQGLTSTRRLRPVAVIYYIDVTVLAAWCHLRSDFRHFRLDRITALRRCQTRFPGEGPRLRARWHAVQRDNPRRVGSLH